MLQNQFNMTSFDSIESIRDDMDFGLALTAVLLHIYSMYASRSRPLASHLSTRVG
jgi:hypothetical protein